MRADGASQGGRRRSVADQVLDVAASVFSVSRSALTLRTTPADVKRWDSVHHLTLILALEQQFGIVLEPEDADEMETLEQIAEIVERRIR